MKENKQGRFCKLNETKGKLYALRIFIGSPLGRWVLTAAAAVLIWGLMTVFLAMEILWVTGIIFLLCVFFGWKALNRIQPGVFLVLPIIGWLIYIGVKFLLSLIVGVFAAPSYIGKSISASLQSTAVKMIDDANS